MYKIKIYNNHDNSAGTLHDSELLTGICEFETLTRAVQQNLVELMDKSFHFERRAVKIVKVMNSIKEKSECA
jgi:hypothetical protein